MVLLTVRAIHHQLLAVLVVPLPAVVLDILIAVNISLAAVVLLTTSYMERPLEFSVFPALLLGATLFRLVLNVASTRLILDADAPNPEAAMQVAGNVIEPFGTFVALFAGAAPPRPGAGPAQRLARRGRGLRLRRCCPGRGRPAGARRRRAARRRAGQHSLGTCCMHSEDPRAHARAV